MSDTEDLDWQFAGVFVHGRELAIVLAVVRKLADAGTDKQSSQVVIAGLAGTLLVGRDDSWRQIQQTETKEAFWGAAVH